MLKIRVLGMLEIMLLPTRGIANTRYQKVGLDSDTERSRFEALSFLVIRNGE